MAEPVTSARHATEIAMSFVRQDYSFARPLKASKKDATWTVEVDVGATYTRIARFEIDAESGEIMTYDIPIAK